MCHKSLWYPVWSSLSFIFYSIIICLSMAIRTEYL
jgi:hypothetical protein